MNINPGKQSFGAWLTELREMNELGTQDDLALRIGVSRVQLGRWENDVNRPRQTKFQAIADAYHVDIKEVERRASDEIVDPNALSDWSMAIARRLERNTAQWSNAAKANLERLIDVGIAAHRIAQ